MITPPPRSRVKALAAAADVHERTAMRALVYGPDAIHGYALREKLRAAIATLPAVEESLPSVQPAWGREVDPAARALAALVRLGRGRAAIKTSEECAIKDGCDACLAWREWRAAHRAVERIADQLHEADRG